MTDTDWKAFRGTEEGKPKKGAGPQVEFSGRGVLVIEGLVAMGGGAEKRALSTSKPSSEWVTQGNDIGKEVAGPGPSPGQA